MNDIMTVRLHEVGKVSAVVKDAVVVEKDVPGVGVPPGGASGQVLTKLSGADYDTGWRAAIGGGENDHSKLTNRDAKDQHPMGAIAGLAEALDGKQPKGDYLTADKLQSATDAALAQAKASGVFDGAPGKDAATDISLGITGATIGQIAKITAVDASGVPTAWEPVDMPSGGGGDFAWEKIADINVADDVGKGVSAWEYTDLPGYDAIMYFKQALKGESNVTSGISVAINGGNSQPSGIQYNQNGYSCVGLIYLSPFGMLHLATGNANQPTNFSNGGMSSMYCPIPADGNRITSIKLTPHTIYKIVSGQLALYGGKHK